MSLSDVVDLEVKRVLRSVDTHPATEPCNPDRWDKLRSLEYSRCSANNFNQVRDHKFSLGERGGVEL